MPTNSHGRLRRWRLNLCTLLLTGVFVGCAHPRMESETSPLPSPPPPPPSEPTASVQTADRGAAQAAPRQQPRAPNYAEEIERDQYGWIERLATQCEHEQVVIGCVRISCFKVLSSAVGAAVAQYLRAASTHSFWFGARLSLDYQGVATSDPLYQDVLERSLEGTEQFLKSEKRSNDSFYDEARQVRANGNECQVALFRHITTAHEQGDLLGIGHFVELGDQFSCIKGFVQLLPESQRETGRLQASAACMKARVDTINQNRRRALELQPELQGR